MFGLLISGRPVLAQPETISPTQYAFTIPSQPAFGHLAVFLLPGTDFPAPNIGATVWFSSSNDNDNNSTGASQDPANTSSPQFKFLGALSPQKHSAMFRLNDADKRAASTSGRQTVVVGISIEPAESIEAQIAAHEANNSLLSPHNTTMSLNSPNPSVMNMDISPNPASMSQSTLGGGGGGTGASVRAASSQFTPAVSTKILAQRIIGNAFNFLASFNGDTVPLSAFRDWWDKFEKKVTADPGFLEREQA